MCMCDKSTCPKCDPGIEAFYQKKCRDMIAAGGSLDWLDAKDIWYEYCALKKQSVESMADDLADEDIIEDFTSANHSW
ncbi:hypothetical protein UFOVP1290_431 [uncultured Caudovirales phage]|uniref:Uncharacterized protein n=1 Tax=uncultured Caudovirales phage TaxID=2100421 RepID=A0A6J5RTL8_9CAUD|nr:hypothetical protein UFOVP1290_431 [uncultured Caudovirales phage]